MSESLPEHIESLLEWELIPPHLRDLTLEELAIMNDISAQTLYRWRKDERYQREYLKRCKDRGMREDMIRMAQDELYRRGMKDESAQGTNALKVWMESEGVFARAKLGEPIVNEDDLSKISDEDLKKLLATLEPQKTFHIGMEDE